MSGKRMGKKDLISNSISAVAYAAMIICATAIALCTVAVGLDVMMRKFANRPILGVTEIVEYMLIYITFLGSAWLLKSEEHIKLESLYSVLPKSIQTVLDLSRFVVVIGVAGILCWYGFRVTVDFFTRGVYNPTLLEFPKYLVILPIPVGSLLMALVGLDRLWIFISTIKYKE